MAVESGYLWLSDSFDSNLCQNYFLYAVLESNRITACVIDEGQAEIKAIQEIPGNQLLDSSENLVASINKIDFIKNDFRELQVGIHSNKNCLLPNALQTKLEKVAAIEITPPNENEKWLHQSVMSGKLNLLGISQSEILSLLEQKLPNVKTKNLAGIFVEEGQRLTRFLKNVACRWLVSSKASYFTVFKNRELLFFNQFEISNTEDLLYYTLNVMEQLQIETNAATVEVSGQVQVIDFNIDTATDYIPNIKKVNSLEGLKTEYINDSTICKNYTLLNMFLCE